MYCYASCVAFCFLDPNFLPSSPFTHILNYILPLGRRPSFIPIEMTSSIMPLYFFTFVCPTYLLIVSHNGGQTGKGTLVPHLCSPVHGAASYQGAVMVEQAVAYFF